MEAKFSKLISNRRKFEIAQKWRNYENLKFSFENETPWTNIDGIVQCLISFNEI